MPGSRFIASRIMLDQALVASTVYTVDLGVNGLSALLVHVTSLQAADNVVGTALDALGAIARLEVLWNGQAVIAGSGPDLAVLGSIVTGRPIVHSHAAEAANAEIGTTFIVPFARGLLHRNEGLPQVRRGELQLQLTAAAAFGDVVTPEVEILQFEIPDENPNRYVKMTTLAATPGATGDFDVDLPVGNRILGIGVFNTTAPRNLNIAATTTFARVLADNAEYGYTSAASPILQALAEMRGRPGPNSGEHAHVSDLGAAYAQFQATDTELAASNTPQSAYLYLDYDPTGDGRYALQTKDYADVTLRLTIGVANALRVIPVELVGAGGD